MSTMVGPLADFPVNSVRRVDVDGTSVCVARSESGVYALTDRCTHADVALSEGEVVGNAIECWLHGSLFDLATGAPTCPPATEPVATWQVVIDAEDHITIESPGVTA